MINKAGHWAADAVAAFQKHCGTGDEHAIADLICDLGHLADVRGFDFLDEVKRGIGHWCAERYVSESRLSWTGRCGRDHYYAEVVSQLKPFTMAVEGLGV